MNVVEENMEYIYIRKFFFIFLLYFCVVVITYLGLLERLSILDKKMRFFLIDTYIMFFTI